MGVRLAASMFGLALAWGAPSLAWAQPLDLDGWLIRGWAPDLQIAGGGGFGVGGDIDNNFLGRVRIGAFYAREPWTWNFGAEAEVGALSEWGFGGELEVNHFKGLFGAVGVGTAALQDVATHVTVGYTIVGLEWQHRFAPSEPQDALLLVVRAPLGLWWFLTHQDDDAEEDAATRAASSGALEPEPEASLPPEELPRTTPEEAQRAALDHAQALEHERTGELARAEQILSRAYALDPRPEWLLDLARIERAQGKLARAVADLERYLLAPEDSTPQGQRSLVRNEIAELLPRVSNLRLALQNPRGDELVTVDGQVFHGALLGYDLRLDAGPHTLIVLRGKTPVARRVFDAKPGELVRLEVNLAAPADETE